MDACNRLIGFKTGTAPCKIEDLTSKKEAHLDYGRLVSVKPPSTLGDAEPVVYVVADEDPDAALKLVADKVVIGSDMKIVGRASRQLLDALGLKPCEVVRA